MKNIIFTNGNNFLDIISLIIFQTYSSNERNHNSSNQIQNRNKCGRATQLEIKADIRVDVICRPFRAFIPSSRRLQVTRIVVATATARQLFIASHFTKIVITNCVFPALEQSRVHYAERAEYSQRRRYQNHCNYISI